jgi:lipopolysaccharide transport system permease protein
VIQRVYYPRILGPLSIVISRGVDALIVLAAIFGLQLAFSVGVGPQFYVLPAAVLTLLALAFGLGAMFAALILFHPDSRKILDILLYLGLFLSPVLFDKAVLPETIQSWYAFNPMVGTLSALRGAMFAPSPIDYQAWLIAASFATILVLVGMLFLERAARVVGERV